ncbi:hypothetical protein ACMT1E_08205 [Sphingomonas flavalba]|uniref:hypothetical protein n=1 Tax=Sphingomonas flavalba TaxID=2559804 RepID=UPI0039DF3E7C
MPARPRLDRTWRVILAVFGGYGFTSAVIGGLSLALPGSRADAVIWSSLAGFVVWTAAVIWVFAVRSVRTAAIGMVGGGALIAASIWLAKGLAA